MILRGQEKPKREGDGRMRRRERSDRGRNEKTILNEGTKIGEGGIKNGGMRDGGAKRKDGDQGRGKRRNDGGERSVLQSG